MPNVLINSEIGWGWGVGERTILGHPQLIERMGICVLSLAYRSELRDSDVYLQTVKKICGNASLDSAMVRNLGWPLLAIFSGFF